MNVWRSCALAAAATGLFIGCLPASNSNLSATDDWTTRQWIAKVGLTLGRGQTPLSDAQIDALVGLPRDQVVDKLMAGFNYEATLIDFLDYFQNTKGQSSTAFSPPPSSITDTRSLVSNYSSGNKIPLLNAGIAIVQGKDFFTYFGTTQTSAQMPITAQLVPGAVVDGDASHPTQAQILAADEKSVYAAHDALAALFQPPAGGGTVDLATACATATALPTSGSSPLDLVMSDLFNIAEDQLVFAVTNSWYVKLRNICAQPPPGTDASPYATALATVRTKIDGFFQILRTYNSDQYKPNGLAGVLLQPDISSLYTDPPSPQIPGLASPPPFPYLDWLQLVNSSTNFDRKRGAYMLRTFFCDDLTPIAVITPAAHAEAAHASDPGCQACHYKLDPMAGFFRDRMADGAELQPGGTFAFDDQVTLSATALTSYLNTWAAPAGIGRDWNVGYIRSTVKPQTNFYASTLQDLYGFMAQAPEVRQCLVQRAAEYFIGKNQVYDGGWINYLTQQLPAQGQPTTTSGAAVKGIIKTLLLSNTFAANDPVGSKCYDFAPGAPQSTLPCEIAWTIQQNCQTCHNADNPSGGLDLTSWGNVPGVGDTFVHLDPGSGQQLSKQATFSALKDRLASTDKNLRMPKNKDMPATDRARLYKWADSVLSSLGPTPPSGPGPAPASPTSSPGSASTSGPGPAPTSGTGPGPAPAQ